MNSLRTDSGLRFAALGRTAAVAVLGFLSACATPDPEPTQDELLAEEERTRLTESEELGVVTGTEAAEASFQGQRPSAGDPVREADDPSITALWHTRLGVDDLRESMYPDQQIEPPTDPKEFEILEEARRLMDDKKFAEAEALVDRYTNTNASPQMFMQLALCRIALDRPTEALEQLRFAVQQFPKFRRAWEKIAQIESQAKNFGEARQAFTKVIQLGGHKALNWGLLGVSELRLGHPLAAETAFRQAIAMNPERPDWKIGLAEALTLQESYPQAIALWGRLIEDEPGRVQFWLARGRSYAKTGQKQNAIRDFEVAVAMDGVRYSDLLTLAVLYWQEGQLRPAVSTCLTALKLDRESPLDKILLIAQAVVQGGDLDEARRLVDGIRVERGDALSVEDQKALFNLDARIAIADGGGPAQAEALEKIRELDPLDGDAHLRLGRYYDRAGNFERAELRYQQAIGLGDEFAIRGNQELARLYYRRGASEDGTKADFAKALQALRRAQKLEFREDFVEFERRLERLSGGS